MALMAQSPNREKFLTGLIGAPIAQSAAPAMHEQAAEALGARSRLRAPIRPNCAPCSTASGASALPA
jgi:shikimate 5-dehydrogenase